MLTGLERVPGPPAFAAGRVGHFPNGLAFAIWPSIPGISILAVRE